VNVIKAALPGTTVVMKLNQGTVRHRGVIDGGAFFGYFLGKQKVTKKEEWETASYYKTRRNR